MSDRKNTKDYRDTLLLPKTDLPMKAKLSENEPLLIENWDKIDTYASIRKSSQGKEKFILHDGPPYANGNVHMGTALNKILKDVIVKSKQMAGFDAIYRPGWDCHGLPIEWKIEEQYREQGKVKRRSANK
jgi:Isoleucyl-tRNA synthetase